MKIKTPKFWYEKKITWLAALLWPLGLLYSLGRRLDVWCSRAPQRPSLPSICVGNVVAGGAGKTPTVQALAILLKPAGLQPFVVLRGYGGGQRAPVLVDTAIHNASQVGDEALMLAGTVPVIVAANRIAGAALAKQHGASCVIFDDGLQSTRLKADVNLLVVDGAVGFGNGLCLPAGPLREPVRAVVPRVAAVVAIGAPPPAALAQHPVFTATLQVDTAALDGTKKYVAFAGLARPEKFFTSAAAAGLEICASCAFADHYFYTPNDWATLQNLAAQHGAQLLTTAKDYARLPAPWQQQVAVLPASLQFAAPEKLLAFVLEKLHATPPQ